MAEDTHPDAASAGDPGTPNTGHHGPVRVLSAHRRHHRPRPLAYAFDTPHLAGRIGGRTRAAAANRIPQLVRG